MDDTPRQAAEATSGDDVGDPDIGDLPARLPGSPPREPRELVLAAGELVGLVAAAAVMLLYPAHTEPWSGRLLGVTIGLVGGVGLWSALRPAPVVRDTVVGLAGVGVGAWLLLRPSDSLTTLGRLLGAILFAGAVTTMLDAARKSRERSRKLAVGAFLAAAGIALWAVPEQLFVIALWIAALVLVLHALVHTGLRLGLTTVDPDAEGPLLQRWVTGRSQAPQQREDVYAQVFFEGATATARTARFALMMFLASVIASMGVVADSTAVVIGAMLVAPLISPMMGMGLSLAMGWPRRLARCASTVAGGIAITLATSAFLGGALDIAIDLEANSQITSRSSPTIIDLIVAVGAGAAGAYALSRKDVSSALPGVAVAIALVPPLAVVGIAAQRQDWEQAAGTLLLFLTNLVAILLVGGLVFVLTGVAPLRRAAANQHRVRTAGASIAALALLVVVGLAINGQAIARDALASDNAGRVVAGWLGDDSEFSVVSVVLDGSDVAVILAGPGDPPPAATLAPLLASELGRRVRVDVQWIPRQRTIVVAAPDD